jgi:hypothetical protein
MSKLVNNLEISSFQTAVLAEPIDQDLIFFSTKPNHTEWVWLEKVNPLFSEQK